MISPSNLLIGHYMEGSNRWVKTPVRVSVDRTTRGKPGSLEIKSRLAASIEIKSRLAAALV